jgi:glycosyltransferase involved in cell wall biosynthesis
MGWYPYDQGNGLDRVFHSLVMHQNAARLRLMPVVVSDPGRPASDVAIIDRELSLSRRLVAIRRAFAAARRETDLVASHFALYGSAVAGRLDELPFVVHFHGPWAEESRLEGAGLAPVLVKKLVERFVYRRADRLIVLSSAFRNILVHDFRLPEDLVEIIPGGVDLDRFGSAPGRDEARRSLGWPTDRPIILSVRRLVRRVGLEQLVEAAARIRQDVPDVLILIAGRGPLAQSLQDRIDGLGLGDSVSLVGFIAEEDLPAAYAAADLTVVPSVGLEGFGLIAAESLAAGTPPVVTPVGGLPEVVSGLCTDLVCENASPEALADRLVAFLQGRISIPEVDLCREFARRHYDWNVIVRRTRAVYDEVVR